MRILIAEDDLASRRFLIKFLKHYGELEITVDGAEALEAFLLSHREERPYDLVCLDIMMPKLDGMKVLKAVREIENDKKIEKQKKTKIIMITALNDSENVYGAFDSGCEGYAVKPINIDKLTEVLSKLGFERDETL